MAKGPCHGAEIRRRVRELSGEAIEVYPAMLYGSLDELLSEGWIEELENEGGGRRRNYGLSGLGRERLAEETARIENVVAAANRALGSIS